MKNKLIDRLKEVQITQCRKVKLTSGGRADFYVDLKKAYGQPDILGLICKCMKPYIKNATCVAGMGHGGIPLATALALKYKLRLSLIREKPRQHGTKSQIDGHIPSKQDRVFVVDDVVTTGGSLKKIIQILRPVKIAGCAVVIKRNQIKLNKPLHYILESNQLV